MSSEDSSSGCCCGSCGQTKRDETRICMCLPYKDGFMITAQIISIVAFLISWLWWVTFTVGLISLVLLQLAWCCRQSKIGLFVSVGISMLAGIACTIAGVVMIVLWKDQWRCPIFYLTEVDDYYDNYDDIYDDNYEYYVTPENRPDYCDEQTWAVVAFVTATFWFTTSGLILYFVGSGRYAILEEKEKLRGASDTTPTTTIATPTAIEMGAIQHQHDDQHQQEQQPTTAATTATAIDHDHTTCSTADSYVLPEISDKVDNV